MAESSWDKLEQKLYDVLVEIKAPTPPVNPGDPPGPPKAVLGNVHRHRPEHEQSDRLSAYYLADVGGRRPEVRAWSVFVTQALNHEALNSTSIELLATVRAWYAKGEQGAGVKLLQEHMSVYLGELRGCGRSIGGTVTIVRSWSQVSYRSESNPVDSREGDVIVGEFTISALLGMGRI